MHHHDFSGDSSGTRKMSHPTAFHHKRGSSGASASPAGAAGGGYVTPAEDQQPPLPVQSATNQAGSSSSGLHQHPQNPNTASQSQAVGAQVKKKSGFQITSVTPAQVSVSTNNSIADDTESYDDMDESHTEDLSSSDMLDVSVSRATDTGVPERSSSDETLNSLHGVETPGVVSPNEPLHPHSLPQASQQQYPGALVNGTVHHHQQTSDQHRGHPLDTLEALPPAVSTSGGKSSVAGSNQAPRLLPMDNTTGGGVAAQPSAAVTVATGTEKHLPGNVNANLTHANVPVVSGSCVPSFTGSISFDNPGLGTAAGAGVLAGGIGPTSSSQAGVAGGLAQPVPVTTTTTQTQTAPGSRFRVVKLDSNSEPFRKGRWMCTEYYEKEVPPVASSTDPAAVPRAGEAAGPEGEAGNGSAASSVGPAGASQTLQPYQQQTQDYTSPQAVQNAPGLVQNPPLPPQDPGAHLGLQQSSAVPSATLPAGMMQGTVAQALPAMAQQPPYAMDPQQGQPQTGYPAPQFSAGLLTTGGGRQPDFIQPTAPFQTQVQGPLAPVSTGVSATGLGSSNAAPVPGAQPLPPLGHGPPSQAGFAAPAQPQHLPALPHPHPPSAPAQGTPYMPLTALQADLQPLLTHGMALSQSSGAHGGALHAGIIPSLTATQLQDAQRLLFQHQSLLGRPRLGVAGGGEGASEAGGAGLAQMGMVGDASALVAAGLRTQPADGEEDSSSGASVVAIDNKIEQAMDLVKSHLMYAVREEVEVLKEQIKELMERNSQLEQENNLLKTLASPEQMAQFQAQVEPGSPTGSSQPPALGTQQALPSSQSSSTSS